MTIGNPQAPYRCFAKLFTTWSPEERVLRLGRVVWSRGGGPGKPNGGYSAKFSLALTPKAFQWRRGWREWHLTLCGLRMHYQRAYGGWIA